MINIYSKYFPSFLISPMKKIREYRKWYKMSKIVEEYYSDKDISIEEHNAIKYLKRNHNWLDEQRFLYLSNIVKRYNKKYNNIEVHYDNKIDLPYIYHNKKPLYYPKSFSPSQIKSMYCQFLSEMDSNSPHLYCRNTNELKDAILYDCGVAEGLFPLNYIDILSKVILFECDEQWIAPLKATFLPYDNKVTIVQKYVSNTDSFNSITLDQFSIDSNTTPNFIKMDIEGFEEKALVGAKRLLNSNNNIICAICTYHTPFAEKNISEIMKTYGYSPEYNKGYMIFHYEKEFSAPYLRRGVIRFKK